jgi:hypothetical protein
MGALKHDFSSSYLFAAGSGMAMLVAPSRLVVAQGPGFELKSYPMMGRFTMLVMLGLEGPLIAMVSLW